MSALYTYRIEWNGIGIAIRHVENRWSLIDHIEITSDRKLPIPITETGYRSHFLSRHEIEIHGNAEGYVKAWLEEAVRSPEWKAFLQNGNQLSLF